MHQPGRARQPGEARQRGEARQAGGRQQAGGGHLARWGKVLGVAGLAGVAATGVLVARDQRQRGSYSPDEIRARLQARAAAEANAAPPTAADQVPGVAAEPTEARRGGQLLGRLPRRLTRWPRETIR